MRIGYYQFRPLFGKVRQNLKKVINVLQDVKADLIVLPELVFTSYHFKDRSELKVLAEDPENSSTVDALIDLCQINSIYLVTGFVEKTKTKYLTVLC